MKLLWPLKDPYISQKFGENLNPYYLTHGMLGHNGIDFSCYVGTPVYAAQDGQIYASIETDTQGNLTGYGHYVTISGKDFRTDYGHLSKYVVQTGDTVKAGDLIGYSGDEGNSTGPHLHFGLKPIPSNYSNGYWGAIDPMPYLIMTNVIFVHKLNTQEYGFYVPAMTEDALRDKAKNFGIDIEKTNGQIDYDKAKNVEGL